MASNVWCEYVLCNYSEIVGWRSFFILSAKKKIWPGSTRTTGLDWKNFLLLNFRKLMPNNVENNAIIKNPENRKHYSLMNSYEDLQCNKSRTCWRSTTKLMIINLFLGRVFERKAERSKNDRDKIVGRQDALSVHFDFPFDHPQKVIPKSDCRKFSWRKQDGHLRGW